MRPEVSVIVMTYNEIASLEMTVGEIMRILDGIPSGAELIIIDDGSTDGSSDLADGLSKRYKGVKVVHHKVNKGLGEVYRTGFANAEGNLLLFFQRTAFSSGDNHAVPKRD
jgi:glycosyltransferase involved in cell wall biosynthesis